MNIIASKVGNQSWIEVYVFRIDVINQYTNNGHPIIIPIEPTECAIVALSLRPHF